MCLDLRINGNKTEIKSAADEMESLSAIFLPCVGKLADTVCSIKQMESLSATFLPCVAKHVETVCRTGEKRWNRC